MKDDQRKGEGLRSDDDGDGDGLSFLLGLVFFSMVMVMVIVFHSSDPLSLITGDDNKKQQNRTSFVEDGERRRR